MTERGLERPTEVAPVIQLINDELEQHWGLSPGSKGDAIVEALTQAFRYVLMTHETSNARAVYQWLVTIFPKKEEKFLLVVIIRYLRAHTRKHQGAIRKSRRYQQVPISF